MHTHTCTHTHTHTCTHTHTQTHTHTHSVAKCPYLSVFLRKFDLESAVRKCSGRFRKFEKIRTDFEKFQSQTNFSFKLTTHHAWGIDRWINLLLTNSRYFLKLDTTLVPGWQHALWVFRAIPLYHKPGSFSPFFIIVWSSSSSSSSSSCTLLQESLVWMFISSLSSKQLFD